jgi:DNA-binding NarL/FixJ family response regulator
MGQSDHDPRRPRVPLAGNPAASSLTNREREVARLVADGLKDILIAKRLGLSPATVRTYIQRIQWRLKLDSRAEIAAWVTGCLDPDDPEARFRRGRDASSD